MSKKNKSDNDNDTYEVGYGKPPKHTRFKPGQSGNKKGRPKGTRNFRTDVKETLQSPVSVTSGGKRRKISTQEAMLFRLKEKALKGDNRAINLLILLAQSYNNEDAVSEPAALRADDALVLETYQARFLSGAAGKPNSATENEGCEDAGTSAELETTTDGAGGKGKRANKPRRSKDVPPPKEDSEGEGGIS